MRMSACALVTMHGRSSEGSSRRSDPVGPLTWHDYSADSRCLDAPPHGGYSWRTGGVPVKCPRCQMDNRADARFCEECGARMEQSCPACGNLISAGKKFCGHCGAALTQKAADRSAAPGAYTPKHLAEKILTTRADLAGERKQVTVLFA